MLRQQQAEIEALKYDKDWLAKVVVEKGKEVKSLEESKDRLIKTLLYFREQQAEIESLKADKEHLIENYENLMADFKIETYWKDKK